MIWEDSRDDVGRLIRFSSPFEYSLPLPAGDHKGTPPSFPTALAPTDDQ